MGGDGGEMGGYEVELRLLPHRLAPPEARVVGTAEARWQWRGECDGEQVLHERHAEGGRRLDAVLLVRDSRSELRGAQGSSGELRRDRERACLLVRDDGAEASAVPDGVGGGGVAVDGIGHERELHGPRDQRDQGRAKESNGERMRAAESEGEQWRARESNGERERAVEMNGGHADEGGPTPARGARSEARARRPPTRRARAGFALESRREGSARLPAARQRSRRWPRRPRCRAPSRASAGCRERRRRRGS